jgi:malate/lactate dehydrogenase
MEKIGIIGLGNVGGLLAFQLLEKKYEISVYDIKKEYLKAQILDLEDAFNKKIQIKQIKEMKDNNVIVICAGVQRKENQTREDLFEINKKIIESILSELEGYEGKIITITNPVDKINEIVAEKFGKENCFGFGGELDKSRVMNEARKEIEVRGIHGENLILSEQQEIIEKVKERNNFVIKNKGYTEYGPAKKLCELVEILIEKKDAKYTCSIMQENGKSIQIPIEFEKGKIKKLFI